jgi:P pilus assembly chaperone PapD
MKKQLFVLISLILFSCSALFSQAKIEAVGGTTRDFGDAYNGSKVDRLVTIRNAGRDTLNISDVKAQCGCTAAMMTTKMLAPGDSGKLSISFNTQNYNGRVTKQVYVSSNDISMPRLTISFNVNVLTTLDMNPKFFSFDNSKLDTTITKNITITNPTKEAVTIVSIGVTSGGNKFEDLKVDMMKKQLMPGEQTTLQAVYHPTKTGTFNGDIDIMTDNKTQPKVNVKFYAWVNRK